MGEAESESSAVEREPETAPASVVAPEPVSGPLYGTGRRKTAVARAFLRPGTGQLMVNQRPADAYFPNAYWRKHAREPLDFVGVSEQYDAAVTVQGGGMTGQAGAVRLGLARALAASSPELRVKLRQGGFLSRNPRMKERKKYGQKGARKRFQWTKR